MENVHDDETRAPTDSGSCRPLGRRDPRKLLVIDASYCLEAIRARGLESTVTCRDLGGYFEHVWSVHPVASLVTSPGWGPKFGAPAFYELTSKHTIIEGTVGRFAFLKWMAPVNFFVSQAELLALLVKLVRLERIGVIRAGDPLYLGLVAWAVSRATGVPFVVRVGGNNAKVREATGKPIMPRLLRWAKLEELVERFVLPRADLVAGANSDNLQFALACGADPRRATLFRYGNLIHPAHFTDPRSRARPTGVSPTERYLLYVGRFEPVKRPADVLRVLSEVRRHGHDLKALMVGDGSQRAELARLADELGIDAHVVFCGNMTQEWLASAFPHAEVVISPHTGRALTEAALGGAPIAGYDIDWQAEMLTTGESGELVAFGDVSALAAATLRLLSDTGYARRVGDRVRALALDMMDPEQLDAHEKAHYERLLYDRTSVGAPERPSAVQVSGASTATASFGSALDAIAQ
jgi:glycosyltransferase involved in cell wall biosynthesis